MKKLLILAMAVLPLLNFVSCKDDDEENEQKQESSEPGYFFCELILDDSLEVSSENSYVTPRYTADANAHSLTIIVDSIFSISEHYGSEPTTFSLDSIYNDTINLSLLYEPATSGTSPCYNDSIKLTNLQQKSYVILFEINNDIFKANVDMSQSSEGVFSEIFDYLIPNCCGTNDDLKRLSVSTDPKENASALQINQ